MGRKAWLTAEQRKTNRTKYLKDNEWYFRPIKKKWRDENREYLNECKNRDAKEAKRLGIIAYGGACSCCQESRPEFLTIEHTEGRGAECYLAVEGKHRLSGSRLWLNLKRAGFPKQGYTLLCFNCNCAKGAFGQCPHERERQGLLDSFITVIHQHNLKVP